MHGHARGMKKPSLNAQQRRFVDEYLIDLKTASEQASRLLTNVIVQDAVRDALKARSERTNVDADYVLRRLVEVDQMDALDVLNDDGTLKPIKEWPKIWRQYISAIDVVETGGDAPAIIKKIKWPDKVKNLELIGKHVAVQAFKDKLEVGGDAENPLHIVAALTPKEKATKLAQLLAVARARADKDGSA
jgi:phage terminase small subunit